MPAAESSNTQLREALTSETDILQRQFIILDFFFEAYTTFLKGKIVRYEQVIRSRGKALRHISPSGHLLDEDLSCRNKRLITTDPDAERIAQMLIDRDSPCWNFYHRDDVTDLFLK